MCHRRIQSKLQLSHCSAEKLVHPNVSMVCSAGNRCRTYKTDLDDIVLYMLPEINIRLRQFKVLFPRPAAPFLYPESFFSNDHRQKKNMGSRSRWEG
jgi:hypothetical protein